MKLCIRTATAIALGGLLIALHPGAAAQDVEAAAIRALAAEAVLAAPGPHPYDERGWLDRFYAARAYAPAWSDQQAAEALALLAEAPTHGLSPDDYDIAALQRRTEE